MNAGVNARCEVAGLCRSAAVEGSTGIVLVAVAKLQSFAVVADAFAETIASRVGASHESRMTKISCGFSSIVAIKAFGFGVLIVACEIYGGPGYNQGPNIWIDPRIKQAHESAMKGV